MFNKKLLSNQIKKLISYPLNFKIKTTSTETTTINIYKDFKLVNSSIIPVPSDIAYSTFDFSLNIPKLSETDYLSFITKDNLNDATCVFSYNGDYKINSINYIQIRYTDCCVPYYAKINTPNGLIEAQYIKDNDIIYGYDFNENKVIKTKVTKAVTATRDHIVKISLEDSSTIEITNNHTVYTTDGWACLDPENCDDFGPKAKNNIAIKLKLDQECLCINKELKKIANIEVIPQTPKIKVCMFTTECENYFTQNYLVHNLDARSTHGGGTIN